MKILRYLDANNEPTYGWLKDRKVGALLGNPFEHHRRLETLTPIERIELLPPLIPGKLISIQKNYIFQGEQTHSVPDIPAFFLKPSQSVVGTNQSVFLPSQSNDVIVQSELAVIIGKPARWITLHQALDYVMGYSCAATYIARDLLEMDAYAQYRASFFDTFTALGPWIETELDPNDIVVSVYKNRSQVHMTTTHDMLFSVPHLVAYLSTIMTLLPGDVILTGAAHPGISVKVNDLIQVEIDGIGNLTNAITRDSLANS